LFEWTDKDTEGITWQIGSVLSNSVSVQS